MTRGALAVSAINRNRRFQMNPNADSLSDLTESSITHCKIMILSVRKAHSGYAHVRFAQEKIDTILEA